MTHQLSLCVIGDLMLDIVTRIPELHLGSVDYPKGFDGPRPIDLRVGGAGAHLARAAAQQGFSPVTLIGKVGAQPDGQPDVAARMIRAELEQHGIRMLLARDERAATGKVIMTYLGHDQRVMVYDRGANGQFTRTDLSSTVLKEIAGADIVFVSGYTLLVPEQAEAVVSCMQEAYQHRRLVVLDVVPHKLYETLDQETFLSYTRFAHLIMSELGTLRHFFPALQTNDDISDIATYLTQVYPALILYPTIRHQYLFDRQGLIEDRDTGYEGDGFAQGLSFGELQGLQTISRHYPRLLTLAESAFERKMSD